MPQSHEALSVYEEYFVLLRDFEPRGKDSN